MGNMFSYKTTPVLPFKVNTVRNVLINQAYCYKCHNRVVDGTTCSCGNVSVFGGKSELGRKVKFPSFYSDCSLLEYTPVKV